MIDFYEAIIGLMQYYSKTGFTTKEIFNERLKICQNCENIKNHDDINKIKCKLCGCPLKKKLVLKRSKCRKGYWS